MNLQHVDEILETKETRDIRIMLSDVKFNNNNKTEVLEMLDNYLSDMFFMCEEHTPDEKLIIILTKRLSVYFCVLLTKIYYSSFQAELQTHFKKIFETFMPIAIKHNNISKKYSDKGCDHYVDHPIISYKSSCSLKTTQQIFNTRRINDVEIYVKWLMQSLKLTEVDVITSSILIKHLYDIKDNIFYEWLKKKYDVIMVVIIIIARKLYGIDNSYNNYYYSKLLRINILEINITEIVLILHMNMYISEREYDDYLGELYLEYINSDK